jgi:integrase
MSKTPRKSHLTGPAGRVPSYRKHKASGQAVVSLPMGDGRRKDVLLGRYGSKESGVAYSQVIAEWEARGRRMPTPEAAPGLTVNQLIAAFMQHARSYYRRLDGTLTNEFNDHILTMRPLKALYGHVAATAFGPLALEAVRKQMIDADLSRGCINQRIGRIKRMFRWAVSKELIPATVSYALDSVAGLQRGRCEAREGKTVKPVARWIVDATLPHVLPPIRAMIELQLLTGARSGEICQMRACDLDMTGKVWMYAPASHKMSYQNKDRAIAIGPRGQEVLKPFLTTDLQAFLFSPRKGMEQRKVALRLARVSKVQPSQVNRSTGKPRQFRPSYKPTSYLVAVRRGADAADRAARQQAENDRAKTERRKPVPVPALVPNEQRIVPRWHPHQLRHSAATAVRKQFGLEGAQATLGHARADVTQIHAEKNADLASRIALKIG